MLSLCYLRPETTSRQDPHFSRLLWETVSFLAIKRSLTFSLPLLLLYLQEEIILAFRAEGYSVRESELHSPQFCSLTVKSELEVF